MTNAGITSVVLAVVVAAGAACGAKPEPHADAWRSGRDDSTERRVGRSGPREYDTRARPRARRDGLDSRRHLLDGMRELRHAGCAARPSGVGRRLLDGSRAGHERRVRAVRDSHQIRDRGRTSARSAPVSRRPARQARAGLRRLRANINARPAGQPAAMVALHAGRELETARRSRQRREEARRSSGRPRRLRGRRRLRDLGRQRVPTEAEFEFAARGGLDRHKFPWGNELTPGGKPVANTWQGRFPAKDHGEDGYLGTSPVTAFPPNGFGLLDMGGNVWQWCADWYRPDAYAARAQTGTAVHDPKGPADSFDPAEPGAAKRVLRGGSSLCTDQYCARYLVGSRGKSEISSGTSNLGFRLVDPCRNRQLRDVAQNGNSRSALRGVGSLRPFGPALRPGGRSEDVQNRARLPHRALRQRTGHPKPRCHGVRRERPDLRCRSARAIR